MANYTGVLSATYPYTENDYAVYGRGRNYVALFSQFPNVPVGQNPVA